MRWELGLAFPRPSLKWALVGCQLVTKTSQITRFVLLPRQVLMQRVDTWSAHIKKHTYMTRGLFDWLGYCALFYVHTNAFISSPVAINAPQMILKTVPDFAFQHSNSPEVCPTAAAIPCCCGQVRTRLGNAVSLLAPFCDRTFSDSPSFA